MQLEQRVEVHELYARDAIHLLAVQHMIEIVVHRLEGVGIAISKRIAKQATVTADAHEVYTPCVDADTFDIDTTLGHQLQATDHFVVECKDVPVEMTAYLNERIAKACQLLHLQLPVGERSQNGSTTCGTQVYGEECSLFCHHRFRFLCYDCFIVFLESQRRSGRS